MSFLLGRYEKEEIKKHLVPYGSFNPVPDITDRGAWDSLWGNDLNLRRREVIMGQAEECLGQEWPPLTASMFREFFSTGDRKCYQDNYTPRRFRLCMQVLAECIENKGRFVDDIVDGIWLICEETTWAVSAHSAHTRLGKDVPLPDPDDPAVALFSCQTASMLAEIYYLMASVLDGVTPTIRKRIRSEVEKRILLPFEIRKIRWPNNNWQPWCCANVLTSAMYLVDNDDRLTGMIERTFEIVDEYLCSYSPDGACDEGPSYWSISIGSVAKYFEWLYERTGGYVNFYDLQIVKDMGEFFPNAVLYGNFVFNYGDCPARCGCQRSTVWRAGERFDSEVMKDTVRQQFRLSNDRPLYLMGTAGSLYQIIREFFWIPVGEFENGTPLSLPLCKYYDDLQLMMARQEPVYGKGWVVGAKAGHNEVSHNHNDVGHFVLAVDGEMVFVDLGCETYTKDTFTGRRYELWTIRGSAHNVPLVNGCEQLHGRKHAASDVKCVSDDNGVSFEMELKDIFDGAAGIESLRRKIEFTRSPESSLSVCDDLALSAAGGKAELAFYTPASVDIDGLRATLTTAGGKKIVLQAECENADLQVVDLKLEDQGLQKIWGETIRKIIMSYDIPGTHAHCKLQISQQ